MLLHKFPQFLFTIIVSTFALMGTANLFLPHCGHLWLFLVVSGVTGFGFGAGHTGMLISK